MAWISLAVSLLLMLCLSSYLLGCRARDGRRDVVLELAQLRREIEEEGCLSGEQVCLLFDVCRQLGLTEGQIQAVVGPGYWLYLECRRTWSGWCMWEA
jgi:hypothetical protein